MKSDHPQVREFYLKKHPLTAHGHGEWRIYKDGVWSIVHKSEIRREIQVMGIKRSKTVVTSGFVTSVLELIKDFVTIPDDQWDANPDIIIFDDCVLDLTTEKTRPHSPQDYATSKLPFKYDPAARSETWEKFLDSTVPEHKDFLQEIAGLCLTPETKYEIALWLHGPPGGGKSTFIRGLEVMLGAKCGVLGLHEIERGAFGLTGIVGKTLLVATESASVINHPYLINKLISGETLTVEYKNVDSFLYKPQAKLIWAMNELPPVDRSGMGLFRRVVPVEFPGILQELRDPQVKETIASEGQAIVNWALVGLCRLKARGRLEIPPSLRVQQGVFAGSNDLILQFLEEKCNIVEQIDQRGNYQKTQSQILFDRYRHWCRDAHHKPMTIKQFAIDMVNKGFEKKQADGRWYWIGITLTAEELLM